MPRRFVSTVYVVLAIFVCSGVLAGDEARAFGPADTTAYWGFATTNLDKTCKPCDDFYQFAMGGWMKSNPIPPEYPTWGSFSVLADKNQQALREILEAAAKSNAPAGSNEQKVGDFYASCMDTAAIEAAGTKPIETDLVHIAQMKKTADLQGVLARLQEEGVGAMFRFSSNQDAKDSSQVIAIVSQGGLGLPERDYYLRDDDKSKKLRED